MICYDKLMTEKYNFSYVIVSCLETVTLTFWKIYSGKPMK